MRKRQQKPNMFEMCAHGNQAAICGMCAKREAMERVDDHADDEWKDEALAAARRAAKALELLTTDDVWSRIPSGVVTHENRAMGPVMTRALKLRWVEKTETWRPTQRPSRHSAPVQVYRSLIREDENGPRS